MPRKDESFLQTFEENQNKNGQGKEIYYLEIKANNSKIFDKISLKLIQFYTHEDAFSTNSLFYVHFFTLISFDFLSLSYFFKELSNLFHLFFSKSFYLEWDLEGFSKPIRSWIGIDQVFRVWFNSRRRKTNQYYFKCYKCIYIYIISYENQIMFKTSYIFLPLVSPLSPNKKKTDHINES